MAQPEDLNSSLIANCVFNAFLSCTALVLNIITILALRKTSSLPTPLKTLLLSLTVSDLGVGLLVQPLYVTRLVMWIEQNTETQTYTIIIDANKFTTNFFVYASFFGVVSLSADRFLAVRLHLRYQELVTQKRVVPAVISFWVLSAILSLIWHFNWIPGNLMIISVGIVDGVCYLTTAFFYFVIYLAVRHHSNQIHVLQAQLPQNGEVIANAARQRKSAIGTFYVYIVYLVCNLPATCNWIVPVSTGEYTALILHLAPYVETLMLLNSSLNPLIYSWKMRRIRHAVMDILRNILPSND